jgi:hypothetical protein
MFNKRESENMETTTHTSIQAMREATAPQQFPPLESVTRPTVATAAAAYYLNRQQQTLRGWACLENGPLRPLRVHGRLAWPVSELKRVLGVTV